jgi:hypothetical protein
MHQLQLFLTPYLLLFASPPRPSSFSCSRQDAGMILRLSAAELAPGSATSECEQGPTRHYPQTVEDLTAHSRRADGRAGAFWGVSRVASRLVATLTSLPPSQEGRYFCMEIARGREDVEYSRLTARDRQDAR